MFNNTVRADDASWDSFAKSLTKIAMKRTRAEDGFFKQTISMVAVLAS
jgi:hypothetical protein